MHGARRMIEGRQIGGSLLGFDARSCRTAACSKENSLRWKPSETIVAEHRQALLKRQIGRYRDERDASSAGAPRTARGMAASASLGSALHCMRARQEAEKRINLSGEGALFALQNSCQRSAHVHATVSPRPRGGRDLPAALSRNFRRSMARSARQLATNRCR